MMNAKIFIFLFLMFAVPTVSRAFTLGTHTDIDFRGWDTKILTVAVNYTGCSIAKGDLDGVIDSAFNVWNKAPTSGLTIVRGGENSDAVTSIRDGSASATPVIACDADFQTTFSLSDDEADVVAGMGGFMVDNGHVSYGYVILNAQNGMRANMSNFSATKLSIILAHEMGHVLGLGHSGDTKALMYYSGGKKAELSLSEDDIAGIGYLNPRDELGGDKAFGCGSVAVISAGAGGPRTGSGSGGGFSTSVPALLEFAMLLLLMVVIYAERRKVLELL